MVKIDAETDGTGIQDGCRMNLQSLREQVYAYLREEILKGHIRSDTTLNLDKISRQLGVSITPLRDALIKLEAERFVTIMPRRAVVVNALTLEDVRDYYQIIGSVEGEVVKEVFTRLGTNQLSAMHQLNFEMKHALRTDAFDWYYKLNISFHDTFLGLSGNKHLKRLIMPMKQRLSCFQKRPCVKEWELHKCKEHDTIIDMIKRGNCAGAVHCIRDIHWSFRELPESIYSITTEKNEVGSRPPARAGSTICPLHVNASDESACADTVDKNDREDLICLEGRI